MNHHRFLDDCRRSARRLDKYGVATMWQIANFPANLLYKTFGIDAELLIDHAWGRENCRISDIKNYKIKSKSVSSSQILPRDYTYEEAKTVIVEMAFNGCRELLKWHVIIKKVQVDIGYSRDRHESTAAAVRLSSATALSSKLKPAVKGDSFPQTAVLEPTKRYGKNAVLRDINFMDSATQRKINEMIGGHRAGYDDPRTKS